MRSLGYAYDKEIEKRIRRQKRMDSYDFFTMLGFAEVHAIDCSSYEGADIIFDLNEELPENLKERFDYVINGGTLEHVFNIAKAMQNLSDMVMTGGKIMHIAPVAGWADHGFYNIQPTFF